MKQRLSTAAVLRLLPLLWGALYVAGCGSEAAQRADVPPADVSVAEVINRDVNTVDEFIGRVDATETVELRPRVSGYIERVLFDEGREVQAGDVLFLIDQRPHLAEYARVDAELDRINAQSKQTAREAARARRLLETRAISQEEHDRRITLDEETRAAVRAARAAVETARLELTFTEVRAPINGRVSRAFVTAGNLVIAGETVLTTIVSMDPIYVYFESDEQTYLRSADLARRGARNRVSVGLANEEGFPHEGTLDFVDNRVDRETGTILGRAVLGNADRALTPGLFARVRLQGSDNSEAILIDDKAILTDQDRKFVYVVGPDSIAERRDVELGRVVDRLRIVTAGLSPGEEIIVHGLQKVFAPGMPVAPHRVAMGAAPFTARLAAAPAVARASGEEPGA